jgi:cytosine/adenosine deaminase-related metal-dependent hydrolase
MSKMFSLHVSEAVREDADRVIDLRPDFVVHLTKATADDMSKFASAGIKVVVCPRSNDFFGLAPNIPLMLKQGLTVALGTDNCMISHPDMLAEISAAYRCSKKYGGISPLEAVNLATVGGRKLLKADGNISKDIRITDDLVLVRVGGDDPLLDLVTEAGAAYIVGTVKGGKLRRTGRIE